MQNLIPKFSSSNPNIVEMDFSHKMIAGLRSPGARSERPGVSGLDLIKTRSNEPSAMKKQVKKRQLYAKVSKNIHSEEVSHGVSNGLIFIGFLLKTPSLN